jgi:hypothetical protein
MTLIRFLCAFGFYLEGFRGGVTRFRLRRIKIERYHLRPAAEIDVPVQKKYCSLERGATTGGSPSFRGRRGGGGRIYQGAESKGTLRNAYLRRLSSGRVVGHSYPIRLLQGARYSNTTSKGQIILSSSRHCSVALSAAGNHRRSGVGIAICRSKTPLSYPNCRGEAGRRGRGSERQMLCLRSCPTDSTGNASPISCVIVKCKSTWTISAFTQDFAFGAPVHRCGFGNREARLRHVTSATHGPPSASAAMQCSPDAPPSMTITF